MMIVLLAIVLGILFSYIGLQNSQLTTLHLFDFTLQLPAYLLAAVTLLLGIGISFFFSMLDKTSTFFTLHQKDKQLNDIAKSQEDLKHRTQQLAEENAHLKVELEQARRELRGEKIETQKEHVKDFFGRIRNGFAS